MKYGLLGKKLSHSYSPMIHSYLGNYAYSLFERESDELESFFNNQNIRGVNITIPYKQTVISYCHELSDTARSIGAVNTIVRSDDCSLIGHNTDYYGFSYMLSRSGLCVAGKKVLVLGTGGASRTVQHVLKNVGARTVVISRTGKNNYENLSIHSDASVLINCTPVGMSPNCPSSLLSLSRFDQLEGVLDLIYNPSKTALLMEAENRGIIAENGLWMLVAQAKESAEWFLGHTLPNSLIDEIYSNLRFLTENIILIGMPGCGKSAIAKLLAERLGRPVLDSDQEIVSLAGKTIPEIFSEDGESYFRSKETLVLKSLGKESGTIIATGGGCVIRPENYPFLHQNGKIFYIQRDISLLETDGRPLSMKADLEEMFHIRHPLYQQFSDYTVDNNQSIDTAVNSILNILQSGGAQ